MAKTCSTYEAKARLSELLASVRKGEIVTITHRGEPVAEIRPIEHRPPGLERRLLDLERAGVISPPRGPGRLERIVRKPGALRRFLESRE